MPKKITKGPIAAKIENASDNAKRALIKAQELAKSNITSFSQDGYDVTITQGPIESNGMLKVFVSVEKDGNLIQVDNPLIFVNPPINVPTGVINQVEGVDIHGRTITEDEVEFREDPESALKQIIIDVIRRSA